MGRSGHEPESEVVGSQNRGRSHCETSGQREQAQVVKAKGTGEGASALSECEERSIHDGVDARRLK